jgi:hypothetical protein
MSKIRVNDIEVKGVWAMSKEVPKEEKIPKEEPRQGVSRQFIEKVIALQKSDSKSK